MGDTEKSVENGRGYNATVGSKTLSRIDIEITDYTSLLFSSFGTPESASFRGSWIT